VRGFVAEIPVDRGSIVHRGQLLVRLTAPELVAQTAEAEASLRSDRSKKDRAGALVIVDIRGQDAAQMALVEDHKVIQALATNRTDHALDVSVLPRGAWGRDDLSDYHRR
jgi:multidrug resistance efflux pump